MSLVMKACTSLSQLRGACFSPYSDFCSLHTMPGCSISLRQLHVDVLLHRRVEERRRHVELRQLVVPLGHQRSATRSVLYWPVRANVSKKSTPCFCRKPFGVKRALYSTTVPCSSSLILNTSLHGSTLALGGSWSRRTSVHTCCSVQERISLSSAAFHLAASGLAMASRYVCGVCAPARRCPRPPRSSRGGLWSLFRQLQLAQRTHRHVHLRLVLGLVVVDLGRGLQAFGASLPSLPGSMAARLLTADSGSQLSSPRRSQPSAP